MEEEKKVTKETKVKMPEANPYSKVRQTMMLKQKRLQKVS